MYKRILIPVDLNHAASWKVALPIAVDMARAAGAELHITCVVPDFGAAMIQGFFPADFERKALEHAETELEKVVADAVPPEIPHHLHLEHGSIRHHILASAEAAQADLIVMASHPPDQIRELLVGSHADWIVRHAPISVLVVRDRS